MKHRLKEVTPECQAIAWCGREVKMARAVVEGFECDECRRKGLGKADPGDPDPPTVTLYSDGSCNPNPGLGAYGVRLAMGEHVREWGQGYTRTTNNRMEMLGLIAGLETLKKPCRVLAYSDSRYVVDGVNKKWAEKWRENNWRKADGMPALNPDLWDRLLDVLQRHDVLLRWVRGHAGDTDNERADRLANEARRGPLLDDPGMRVILPIYNKDSKR